MTDALVEAVARAIEHQHDYGEECLVWHEQAEAGGGYKFTRLAMLSLATAALQAIEAAGYRVVPVEASEGMVNAGIDQTVIIRADDTEVRSVWSAMLSAAPRVGDL